MHFNPFVSHVCLFRVSLGLLFCLWQTVLGSQPKGTESLLSLVQAEDDPIFKCIFSQFDSHNVCLFRLSLGKSPNAFFVYDKSYCAACETVSLWSLVYSCFGQFSSAFFLNLPAIMSVSPSEPTTKSQCFFCLWQMVCCYISSLVDALSG